LFSIIFLLCTGKDKELKEKVRKESTKNNGTAIQQSHNLNPEIVKSNFTSLNLYVRSLNLYAGNPNLYSTKSIPWHPVTTLEQLLFSRARETCTHQTSIIKKFFLRARKQSYTSMMTGCHNIQRNTNWKRSS